MVPVKDWNFKVETEVKKLSSNGCCKLLCRICCTMVSKGNLNDHVTSKHKRTFLSDVNLPEPDLWCAICGKIVLMADWNKHTVSEHKESLRKGCGDLWCRVCNRAVPSKDWNAHGEGVSMTKEIQAKHNMKFADGFWDLFCSKCNIMVSGKKWNEHMEAEHKGSDSRKMFYCSQHKEYFLDQQSKESHVKNCHRDWFYCDLCDDIFPQEKREHFKGQHPSEGYVCACGAYFRKDCNDGKTEYDHLSKHFVRCKLCNNDWVTRDHIKINHGYDLDTCKPEKIAGDKVWNWRHDPSCKSMLSCPLMSSLLV